MIAISRNGSTASTMRPPRGGTTFMARGMGPPGGAKLSHEPACRSQLSVGCECHVARIEAQLDIRRRAKDRCRGLNADRILRLDVLAEQIVLEAEAPDQIHDLRQFRSAHEVRTVLWRVIHMRGLELGLEAREVRAGEFRHCFARGLALFARLLH